jgi:GBP family porin
MKKTHMVQTLMIATLASVSSTGARAQSSVTLYGIIDGGLTYSSNIQGHSAVQTTGAIIASHWGFLGTEDLGGGLKANFKLENGFNVFNGALGQAGREFGREAWIGLSSDRFGKIILGRQYDSVVDYLGPLSLTGTGYGATPAAHPFDNDNLDNAFRVNNAVKFQSANYSGFQFGGLYGFSNQPGGFSNNRAYSFGTSYTSGPLYIAAGYLQLNSNVNSPNSGGAVTGDTDLIAGTQRTFGAGLTYAFSTVTAGFVFTQTKLENAVGIYSGFTGLPTNFPFTDGSVRFDNYEVNARWTITPAVTLSGAYTFTNSQINGGQPKFHQVTVQAAYSLSKRTDVVLQGEYVHVADAQGTGIGAFVNSVGMSSSPNLTTVTLGLRVRF